MILKRQDLVGGQGNYLHEEALASLANGGVTVPLSNPLSSSEMNRALDPSSLRPSSYFNTNNNTETREAENVADNKPQGDPMPAPAPAQTILTQPQNHFQTTVPVQSASNIFNAGYNQESAPITPQAPMMPQPVPAMPQRLETKPQAGTEGRRLVVGTDISLNGEITTCDVLIVEGNVQAVLKDCKHIVIAQGGTFKGNAEIDNAEISGVYEGNIVVRDRLHITGSGRIQGSVRYGQLQVDPGAEINAEIQSLNAPSAPRAVMPVAAAPGTANPQNRTTANRSGGAYSNLYGTTAASGSF